MDKELLKIAILRNLFVLNLREQGGQASGTAQALREKLDCQVWNAYRFNVQDFELCLQDCLEMKFIEEVNQPNSGGDGIWNIKFTPKGEAFAESIYVQFYIEDKGLIR